MSTHLWRSASGRLRTIVLAAIAVYLSFVGAEILFYIYTGINYVTRPAWQKEQQRIKEDEATKRAFLKAHPEYTGLLPAYLYQTGGQNTDLVKKYSFLPLGHGLPNTPLIYCNEGYGFLKYKTDRYGFHNDDAVWEAKQPWLLIGDSFAHGACVPSEYNIASQLMKDSGASVINLGSGGNGPDRYTALARVFIPLKRPRRVVLVFYENDFDTPSGSIYVDQTRLYAPYFGDNFRESTKGFYDGVRKLMDVRRSQFIEKKQRTFSDRMRKSWNKVVDAVDRVTTLRDIRNTVLQNVETYNYVQLAIETTASECAKLQPSCDIVVVYIPPSQYSRSRPERFIHAQVSYLRTVTEKLGKPIAFIDLSESLKRSSYAPKGPHLSIEGYGQVAEAIMARTKNAQTHVLNRGVETPQSATPSPQ